MGSTTACTLAAIRSKARESPPHYDQYMLYDGLFVLLEMLCLVFLVRVLLTYRSGGLWAWDGP